MSLLLLVEKTKRCLNILLTTDDSDREDSDEENSDKENSNEGDSDEEN